MSEGQKQWWDFKAANFDSVLLFKMGKFYEASPPAPLPLNPTSPALPTRSSSVTPSPLVSSTCHLNGLTARGNNSGAEQAERRPLLTAV